ncbi:MAG: phycobiliprotein lyase [Leptolyngbyaceae cyanobacterium CSU_1_4]|nr:phycobiliprotein lyase [Leptolyngbyaceae cyanobacterium CSU_1_4]
MLTFQDFFVACDGFWTTERTYHSVLEDAIERSYTEFRAKTLNQAEKQKMLLGTTPTDLTFPGIKIDVEQGMSDPSACPGFAIAFETRSETGEEVSMSLTALFVPDRYITSQTTSEPIPLPLAAQVPLQLNGEVIQGFYLRDQGYSEGGAIAGRFTYQPARQTLEMTTYYNRSVAVDQMRFVNPDLRLRTIVTYERPQDGSMPTVINLIGFGVERKQMA